MTVTVLGYTFSQSDLARAALRHPSAPGRAVSGGAGFERLEFLGDRVLGLIISGCLYTMFPAETEGALSRRLSALVRAGTLAAIAREVGLSAQLTTAAGEAGSLNDNILADALEAVLGAIYLDGGLAAAQPVILRLWQDRLSGEPVAARDSKTELQEWAQARGPQLPQYEVLDQSGPSHAPVFEVRVSVVGGASATGQGSSKRQAEQAAAAALLEQVGRGHG